jgi:hypothetical protein
MAELLENIEQQLPKSQSLAFHFTDKVSAGYILSGNGIRASRVGQLGGGVSVCITSPVDMAWDAFQRGTFKETVGRRLWGSKWEEVMPGGPFANKLEVMLVVKVPTVKDQRQYVPGRDDIYILPAAVLLPDDDGESLFYSNCNIVYVGVLEPPSDTQTDRLVELSNDKRAHWVSLENGGGMVDALDPATVDLEAPIDAGPVATSEFVAKVGRAHHKSKLDLAKEIHLKQEAGWLHQQAGKEIWEENVARFTVAEMEAAVHSISSTTSRGCTLAYFFTTKEHAKQICSRGGSIRANSSPTGIAVCIVSPDDLGWQRNAGGDFKQNIAGVLWQDELRGMTTHTHGDQLEAMLILTVPNVVLENAANQRYRGRADMYNIPEEFLTVADGESVYSNAHVLKQFVLDPEEEKRDELEVVKVVEVKEAIDTTAAPRGTRPAKLDTNPPSLRGTTPPRQRPPSFRTAGAVVAASQSKKKPPPLPLGRVSTRSPAAHPLRLAPGSPSPGRRQVPQLPPARP